MNRVTYSALAVLAGVAMIWLVQIAAAIAAAIPGTAQLLRWFKRNNLPPELVTQGLLSLLPVLLVSVLVGLVVFRLKASRPLLFVCTAVPFVTYSLYMNIGMFVAVGNSLATALALASPLAWLIAAMTPVGLLAALAMSPAHREA
jgi:hypothetical protein